MEQRNNKFLLDINITEAGTPSVTKTLSTAGKFVDKDIEIDVTVASGKVNVPSMDITVAPSIIKVDNGYEVIIQDVITNEIIVDKGWVDKIDSQDIKINGSILLQEAGEAELLFHENKATYAENDYIEILTKQGYNEKDIKTRSFIDFYQGSFIDDTIKIK